MEGDRLRVEAGPTADQSHHLLLFSLSLSLCLSPSNSCTLCICISKGQFKAELRKELKIKRDEKFYSGVGKKKKRKASKIANLPLTFIPQPKEWPPKVKVWEFWENATAVSDVLLAHILTSNTLYM